MLNRQKSTWRAFGESPEELSFLGLEVKRIREHQLSDIITVVDEEFPDGFSSTVIERLWPVVDHPGHSFTLLSFQHIQILALDDFL